MIVKQIKISEEITKQLLIEEKSNGENMVLTGFMLGGLLAVNSIHARYNGDYCKL